MSEELLGMFGLMKDEGVINVPKPDPGGGGSADASGLKVLHKWLATKELMGNPKATSCTCS